ncbi:MAG: hypothetical protein FWF77_06360 [Defluviitaleaceae bacterium]|nr:hypothetical protein [Defluviitaleaceae bacterium]
MDSLENLKLYYAQMDFERKKDFILKLKTDPQIAKSAPHRQFLEECILSYNAEVRERNKSAGFAPKERKMPDISPDTFAKALATLVHGEPKVAKVSLRSRLLGKWQRDPEDGDFYYKFNEDGTFETNEFEGATGEGDTLVGNFSVGADNVVLMEPHEKLRFTSLMFSQNAESLIIRLKDGLTFEYARQA